MSPQTEVLTLAEVAEWLKVSERTVLRMIDAGTIPAFKVGRQWRFRGKDVDAYLESQAMNGGDIDERRAAVAKQEDIKRDQQRTEKEGDQ